MNAGVVSLVILVILGVLSIVFLAAPAVARFLRSLKGDPYSYIWWGRSGDLYVEEFRRLLGEGKELFITISSEWNTLFLFVFPSADGRTLEKVVLALGSSEEKKDEFVFRWYKTSFYQVLDLMNSAKGKRPYMRDVLARASHHFTQIETEVGTLYEGLVWYGVPREICDSVIQLVRR